MNEKDSTVRGIVALVGRPNVGKSTLFNCLTRSQTSIVNDQPGVTRDRIYGQGFFDRSKKRGFTVIDTGGFESKGYNFQPFTENLVWRQTEAAITEADLVVLLLDGKHGWHQFDAVLLQSLVQQKKPFLCVVNKIDGKEQGVALWEFLGGTGQDCLPISAAHSRGIPELMEAIEVSLRALPIKAVTVDPDAVKVALIGRPNAGKSSLLNRLVGEERSLVSDIPGTTRDSLDTPVRYEGKSYLLIDTAGIRRKTRVTEELEVQSVIRSLRAIDRADVVVHVIDAIDGITDQDARLINLAIDRFKPVVIVVNKWDLIPDKNSNSVKIYTQNVHTHFLKDISFVPLHFTSCLQNKRVHQLWEKVADLNTQYCFKVGTARLNEVLGKAVDNHTPQLMRKHNKRIKFYYATQVAIQPPTLVIKCNVSDEIQESYKRYLLNQFRSAFPFASVPIKVFYRPKSEEKKRVPTHDSSSASVGLPA